VVSMSWAAAMPGFADRVQATAYGATRLTTLRPRRHPPRRAAGDDGSSSGAEWPAPPPPPTKASPNSRRRGTLSPRRPRAIPHLDRMGRYHLSPQIEKQPSYQGLRATGLAACRTWRARATPTPAVAVTTRSRRRYKGWQEIAAPAPVTPLLAASSPSPTGPPCHVPRSTVCPKPSPPSTASILPGPPPPPTAAYAITRRLQRTSPPTDACRTFPPFHATRHPATAVYDY